MGSNIRVGWYNDHDDATLSVDVDTVSGFTAENTQNTIRSSTLRTVNAGAAMTLVGVLPENRVGSWLHIPRHALKGASVQLKLYSDAGASSLALDAGIVNVPCYTASETFTDSKGTNDPFASQADIWLYFAETTYRSYKLIVSGTPDVSYYEIGRIRLMRYMEMAVNPDYGLAVGLQAIEDRVRTQGGSLRGNMSAMIRTAQFDLNNLAEDEYATWLDGYRLVGTTGEVSISVFPGDGTRKEALHTMAGTFSAINSIGRQVGRLQNRVQFEEN